MAGISSTIEDDRLKPYFIKLVNSNYEVHQKHTPKDKDKLPYTKFVASMSSIKGAIYCIMKRKLSQNRRTNRTIKLAEYLTELSKLNSVLDELLDDSSIEKQFKILKQRFEKLHSEFEEYKKQNPLKSKEVDFNF